MKKIALCLGLLISITLTLKAQESDKFLRMPIGGGIGLVLDKDNGASMGWGLHAGLDYFPFKRILTLNGLYTGAEFRYESFPVRERRGFVYGKIAYLFNNNKEAKYWLYAGIRHVLTFGKESFNDKIHNQVINTRYLVAEPFIGVQKNRYAMDINLLTDYRLKTIKTARGESVNTALLIDSFGFYVRMHFYLFR